MINRVDDHGALFTGVVSELPTMTRNARTDPDVKTVSESTVMSVVTVLAVVSNSVCVVRDFKQRACRP